MKKLILLSICGALAGIFSGCLHSPDATYTYWRYSKSSQMYSPIRTEKPLTQDEMREQGLTENLPDNAKTTEAP